MSEKEEEEEVSPSSLFLFQISQIWCLILSHPLYFSYILFLSPYILKVLSFLSPLIFTTTFLLLLACFFFTFSHSHHQNQNQNQFPDDLEWFNTVFNSTPSEITIIQSPLEAQEPEIKKEINNNTTTTVLFSHVNKEEITKHDHHITDQDGIIITKLEANIMGMKGKSSFLGFKKVFEKDDEDKMDLLWEKYEDKEILVNMGKLLVEVDQEENKNKYNCNSKKKDLRSLVNHQKEIEEEEEEEEENGKICCLQALKFSTAKMRFGMGKKSGFRKISKAFKGLKLLHQLAKNGKNNPHS